MTTPRKWPNEVATARDQAAELLVASSNRLEPIVEDRTAQILEIRLAVTRAYAENQRALRLLESVGAKTRPTWESA